MITDRRTPMTDIEAKARAIIQSIRTTMLSSNLGDNLARAAADELERAIEREAATEARHAAELRNQAERFSEAVKEALEYDFPNRSTIEACFSSFILPAPDPLVEEEDPIDALVDLFAPILTRSQGMAARERENRFRNALAALKARGV